MPEITAQTVATYRATIYRALASDIAPAAEVHIDAPSDKTDNWLADVGARSATFVTACNPFGERVSAEVNRDANAEFESDLKLSHLRYVPAKGDASSGEWTEPGFCVFDATDEQIAQWLTAWRQNAVVHVERGESPELIWHPDRAEVAEGLEEASATHEHGGH
jgi:hypothetical protein